MSFLTTSSFLPHFCVLFLLFNEKHYFVVTNWLQGAVLSGQSIREFCFQLGRCYDEDATQCDMQFKEYKKS